MLVPSQPRDLTVNMLSDESVLLSWRRPLYTGGKLKKYVISYDTDSDKEEKELKSGMENENITMVVNGLNSKRKYDVQVKMKKQAVKLILKFFPSEASNTLKIVLLNISSSKFRSSSV